MKKYFCVLLAVTLLLSLAGCSWLTDDTEIHTAAASMLDALLADDYASSYDHVVNVCSEEEYATVYPQFRQALAGIESFRLELLSLRKNSVNGRSVTQAVYRIQSDAEPLLLTVILDSEIAGLTAFYINPDDETVVSYNGDLTNMRDASVFQWSVLVFAGLELAFTVWVLVDCCRHKFNRKVLWILLILLASVVITFTRTASSFRLNFNLGIFLSYSSLLKYTDGSTVIQLQVPLGAIIYLCKRKQLLAPPPEESPIEEVSTEETPATEAPTEETSELPGETNE